MLELRKKRSIIIFKITDYYKKAYKHLIKREQAQDIKVPESIIDRAQLNEIKSRLYMLIGLNFMDLACMDE